MTAEVESCVRGPAVGLFLFSASLGLELAPGARESGHVRVTGGTGSTRHRRERPPFKSTYVGPVVRPGLDRVKPNLSASCSCIVLSPPRGFPQFPEPSRLPFYVEPECTVCVRPGTEWDGLTEGYLTHGRPLRPLSPRSASEPRPTHRREPGPKRHPSVDVRRGVATTGARDPREW